MSSLLGVCRSHPGEAVGGTLCRAASGSHSPQPTDLTWDAFKSNCCLGLAQNCVEGPRRESFPSDSNVCTKV